MVAEVVWKQFDVLFHMVDGTGRKAVSALNWLLDYAESTHALH